jgi:hypothetical protein
MSYKKFLALLSVLLVFPIVRADGCGIVCPKGANDLLTFSLATLCNFFTWGFCHIFAFIILAIVGIVIFVFWKQQNEDKRKTVKMFLYALFGIFILVILYPYIKAFVYTPVSIPDSCSTNPNSVCVLSGVSSSLEHMAYSSTNYWFITCLGSGDFEAVISTTNGNPDWNTSTVTGGSPQLLTISNLPIGNYNVTITDCNPLG